VSEVVTSLLSRPVCNERSWMRPHKKAASKRRAGERRRLHSTAARPLSTSNQLVVVARNHRGISATVRDDRSVRDLPGAHVLRQRTSPAIRAHEHVTVLIR